MANHSGGILLYRYRENILEVLLVHPGGPFWAKKDDGAWSIPKGLVEESEDILIAAKREFKEETSFDVDGEFIELGSLTQPSKKVVTAFALQHDLDVSKVTSNIFELEWPPKSGKKIKCPEIDKAAWLSIPDAKVKILKGQSAFLTKLTEVLNYTVKEKPTVSEDTNTLEAKQMTFFDIK